MVVKFLEEFKRFAIKGNVIDLAVGIIVGAAFGRIVNSLVQDVLMPPIGLLIGGVDFSDLQIALKKGSTPESSVSLKIGQFLNEVINFLIISFSVFVVVKVFNSLKKEQTREKECKECFMKIPLKAKKCPYCLENQHLRKST